MQSSIRAFFAIILLNVVFQGSFAQAQEVDDLYLKTQQIITELNILHAANGTQPAEKEVEPELKHIKPRHLFMKARTTLRQAMTLAKINNQAVSSEAALPNEEINLSHVKALTEDLLKSVQSLKVAFRVEHATPALEKTSGKTNEDIYHAYRDIQRHLVTLGLPKLTSNEVFQRAVNILEAVNRLADNLGGDRMEPRMVSRNIKPSEVYTRAAGLYTAMNDLMVFFPDLAPVGGLGSLFRKDGGTTPQHVLEMLGMAIADFHSIAVKRQMDSAIEIAPLEGGRSPADVYDVISAAQNIVSLL